MHALLVGWSRGILDFVWKVASWLHWLSLNCSLSYTLILWNVPGVPYGLGRDREFRGLPIRQWKCLWGVDMQAMHSLLSFFQCQTWMRWHHIQWTHGKTEGTDNDGGPSCSHITWIGISLKCFPVKANPLLSQIELIKVTHGQNNGICIHCSYIGLSVTILGGGGGWGGGRGGWVGEGGWGDSGRQASKTMGTSCNRHLKSRASHQIAVL